MKTFLPKVDIQRRQWRIIDANGAILGRLAAQVANALRGKDTAQFTPHLDAGTFVVVINAEKVLLTGNKAKDKVYHWHTGYIGGIKERTPAQFLSGRTPERVVENAVQRMLPRGPLGKHQFANLRVFAGPNHPHEAQQPEKLDIAKMNPKNTNYRQAKAG